MWLYDDVKSLMGMSNVLRRCKICLRAIRNASMTDQTVKAGTQEDPLYWLLYVACTCVLFLPPSEYAHALYSVAFPVDMVALALVVRCVCMHRIFFVHFFQFWTSVTSLKLVQKWQSEPDVLWYMFGKFWHIQQSADCHQCGLICSTDDVAQEAKSVLCAYFSKPKKSSLSGMCVIIGRFINRNRIHPLAQPSELVHKQLH